ncbi:MAG: ATP-binding cassette domain-containing protein [Acidihalobacter sp.]
MQRVGLEIVGITKSYGDQPALRGVDLDVQAGEFFTLLGPSGCGKTTLLRIVAGLEQPDSGHINIGDREVTHEPAHTRRVNTVFQSYALFPHLNVADNVGFGLRMLRVNKAERQRRVAEMLEFMHIAALAERRAEQLSGGQQQRVALARALVNEPDILLLDEPLSALDAKLRGDLQLELKRTQRRLGTTFILVTHDQHEALTLSDRIAVMHEGRVEQIGAPAELYETPRTPYVADFLGLSNCLKVLSADGRKVETPVGSLLLTSRARTTPRVQPLRRNGARTHLPRLQHPLHARHRGSEHERDRRPRGSRSAASRRGGAGTGSGAPQRRCPARRRMTDPRGADA